MKEFIKAVCFIGGCLFFIPFIIVYAGGYYNEDLLQKITMQNQSKETEAENAAFIDKEKLIGILAKEIPYTYEYETIKAQAVIIRTYLGRRILGIQNKGELDGYTPEEMKELWGEHYDSIYATYEEAVSETQNEMIFYKNEPIEALYHQSSGGRTRGANGVYNVDIPYLQGVVSAGDNVTKQVEIKKSEMAAKLKEAYADIILDENMIENQIQIVEKDEAEYIKSIQIGNRMITGEDFKNLLGLPSSNFKIFKKDDMLIFDVRGVGHGVGLSQNGANELAKAGKTYKDIIMYYYKDVTLENYAYKK
jgi:stage II sporulation protein D